MSTDVACKKLRRELIVKTMKLGTEMVDQGFEFYGQIILSAAKFIMYCQLKKDVTADYMLETIGSIDKYINTLLYGTDIM